MQMPQWDFAMAFFRCFPKQSCSIARATVQEGSPASPQLAEAGGSAGRAQSWSLSVNLFLLSRAGLSTLENFTGTDHCLRT